MAQAGCGVDYEKSRLGSGITGNGFDKYTDYQFITIAPAVSYEVSKELSLGVAANFNFSSFATNAANSSYLETSGSNSMDHAYGGGFVVGAIYNLKKIAFGLSYTSKQWMGSFRKYQDVVPQLDLPQQIAAGIAFRPTDKWLIETDFKWINWKGSQVLREIPSEGGFGWEDQYVYAIGSQYQLTPKIALRAGYSYGKTPIREDRVFANALFPSTVEHHLGLGIGIKTSAKSDFSLTYEHGFKNELTDNGTGDSYSANGKGTKIDLVCNAIIAEWRVKF